MLHHPTLDQMHQLGLTGMAAAFQDLKQSEQDQPLSHSDWLAILLDREAAMRADIVHNAHRITLTGESMRKAQSELDQETLNPLTDTQS